MAMMPFWGLRLGVVVNDDAVHVAALRSGRVVWSRTTTHDGADVAAAVRDVLARQPRRRARGTAIIALGPRWVQLRLLRGLPPLRDDVAIRAAVAENADRYFLRGAGVLATTGVAWTEERAGWAAAFDAALVDELAQVCSAAGYRLDAIVPADALDTADPRAIAALKSGQPLMHVPTGALASRNGQSSVAWAGAAFTVAALLAWMAPALTASVVAWHAERELRLLGATHRAAIEIEREEQGLLRAGASMTRLFAGARSVTVILAQVAAALPEDDRLVAFATDTAGGGATIVALDAEEAVAALNDVPGIGGVELQGPITRTQLNGEIRERIVVRFQWRQPAGAGR